MDWWDKLRRAWLAIKSQLLNSRVGKLKKKTGTPNPEAEDGYLKLRSEVENCEYEDVHVLWNLLSLQMCRPGSPEAAAPPASPPKTTTNDYNEPRKNYSWKRYLCSANNRRNLVLSA